MNVLYTFVLLGFFSACYFDTNKIEMIQSEGLSGDNLRLNTLIFCNKDTGFIAGSSDKVTHNPNENSDTFAFVKRTAFLYKTTDGGKTWVGKDFGEGFFTNIVTIRNTLFAFKTSDDYSHIVTYRSADMGNTWNENLSFPNEIYDLLLIENDICALGIDSSKSVAYFYKSGNDGNWTKGLALSYKPFDNPISYKDKMLYLSNSKSGVYFPNLLVAYDIKNNATSITELPQNFNCYFLTNNNGDVKLIGVQEGHIVVYSLQNDNRIKLEYTYLVDNLLPQGYYNNGSEEWIVVGERNKTYVSNKILKTSDKGKNWETINFEKDDYIKPFYFLNDNKLKAWFYSGSGSFQILE